MPQTPMPPAPWRWEGEDYRGDWGWQILVDANGNGIAFGSIGLGEPYPNLKAYQPLDVSLCKTGFYSSADSPPAIHVVKCVAHLIAAAPELYLSLEIMVNILRDAWLRNGQDSNAIEAALAPHVAMLAKARGEVDRG